MKLQFNLLPDVKQEYLKTKRTKRTIITAAAAVTGITLFIMLFMMITVYVVNKKQLNDANNDISKYSKQLKAIPNLDKILTVQNQLKSLSGLHEQKHKVSRLFTFLPQITPLNVCIGKIDLDLATNALSIDGTSDSQKSINTFIDTLKFTKYDIDGKNTDKYAFPSVVESQFGIDTSTSSDVKCNGKTAPASYQVTIQYDEVLFASTNNQSVELKVPQGLVTTRSVQDNPSSLFTGATGTNKANTNTNTNNSGTGSN
jgi:Tfp pilus assembly protein PilN